MLRVKKKKVVIFSIIIFTLLLSACFTTLGLNDKFNDFTAVIWTVVAFFIIAIILNKNNGDNMIQKIIVISFLIRFGVLLIDLTRNDIIGDILNIRDYQYFQKIAESYYQGDFSSRLSNYPYIIYYIYRVVGLNPYIARLINVIISIFTMDIINSILKKFEIKEGVRYQSLLIMGLSPYCIIYSMLLMRESIYLFCISASFCFFLKWKLDQNDINIYISMMSLLPALYLHSGFISVLMILLLFFLNDKRKRNNKQIWNFAFRVGIVVCIIVFVTGLQSMHYLTWNNGDLNIVDQIQRTYRQHSRQGGGSQYLSWMKIPNSLFIIIFTPIRMFFFLTSPFILDWRGLTDFASFILDGMFHLIVVLFSLKSILNYKKSKIFNSLNDNNKAFAIKIGLILIIVVALTFCWGTTTSGAAIRHRNCLYGIETVLYALLLSGKERRHLIFKKIL